MSVRLPDLVRGAAKLVPRTPQLIRALTLALKSDTTEVLSIGAMVEAAAERHPDHPALRFEAGSWTYRELNVAANQMAAGFRTRGVVRGEVVALMADNCPELLFAVVGLAKLGATAALINTAQREQSLGHSLAVANATWGAATPALKPVLETALERPVWDLSEIGDGQSTWNPASTGAIRLGEAAYYIYTSGTTGLPKASVCTHLRFVKGGSAVGQALVGLTRDDVVYVPLPFFHTLALTMAWSSILMAGATLAMGRRFTATGFWDECRQHEATVIAYIGEVPRYLMALPEQPSDREHTVRTAVGVGFRNELWAPFQKRFGVERICELYGASEANTVFINLFGLQGTIGFCPTPHKLVQWDPDTSTPVRDAAGHLIEVGPGVPGLLIGKVTPRYPFDGYTDPDASASKLFRDPFGRGETWFNSGDLLKKIGWGHAVFVDRVGDTFRWKSENVATAEVEAALTAFPDIDEAAVYGVNVPTMAGRAGMAAIVASALDLEALSAHLERTLPPYAIPVFLRQVESLTVTGTFKHMKKDLKDESWTAPGTLVRISGRYEPLDETRRSALEAGRLRL